MRSVLALMVATALGTPAVAASPFDGTWKADAASAELPAKPDVIELKDGVYACTSCVPVYRVPADGVFHPVTGHPYLDEASIRIVDAATVREANRRGGKPGYGAEMTVSADGNTLLTRWTDAAADGTVTSGETRQLRVAPAPAGAHAVSGAWRTVAVGNLSDSAATLTLKLAGDVFTLAMPGGYGFTARLGGPPVAITGDPARTMTAVRRLDAATIEQTDSRDGKVVAVQRLTALHDGTTIKVAAENRLQGTRIGYLLRRQ